MSSGTEAETSSKLCSGGTSAKSASILKNFSFGKTAKRHRHFFNQSVFSLCFPTPRMRRNFCPDAELMSTQHLHASRGWELVRSKGQLTYEESVHIADCESCNSWLMRFVDMAKKAGFEIKLWIPPLDSTKQKPT